MVFRGKAKTITIHLSAFYFVLEELASLRGKREDQKEISNLLVNTCANNKYVWRAFFYSRGKCFRR